MTDDGGVKHREARCATGFWQAAFNGGGLIEDRAFRGK